MSNKSIFVRIGMFLLPMTVLLFSAFAASDINADNPAIPVMGSTVNAPAPCPTNKATDAAIVKAIQDKIKADTRFHDQRNHINVSCINRVVKLEGWVRDKAGIKAVSDFSQSIKCVKKVINKLSNHPGGCTVIQKPCCEICIDKTSICNCMN